MKETVCVTVVPEKEKNQDYIKKEIFSSLKKKGIEFDSKDVKIEFVKKSVDARHGKVKFILRYDVYIGEEPPLQKNLLPVWQSVKGRDCKKVLVVGSGPAGLFGALRLLESGIKPVILERGADTRQRKRDIALISTKGILDGDSNYCFGEGGAGTFSDGKLFTRSTKRGDVSQVLRIFNYFGADASILTDAHPHIGTDKLPYIINAMREKIKELGGEFHFNTRCTSLITRGQGENLEVAGLNAVDTLSGKKCEFFSDAVLLATGHSSSDVYSFLAKDVPFVLEAKTFAVGVRVEHPRTVIDNIQYHGKKDKYLVKLPAAEYSLTSQQEYLGKDARGVYTFCMCPGGFVVPSATEPGTVVVNGMSAAGRNSLWSNSAVVVETHPEDIPAQFKAEAKDFGCEALAGLLWRHSLEREAYVQANGGSFAKGSDALQTGDALQAVGQKAPAQLLQDFIMKRDSSSESLPRTSYMAGVTPCRLDERLVPSLAVRLKKGFEEFNTKMKGFICPEALLIGVETRTSTPVRIVRDAETGECRGVKNLYPAGEGAGYSGGIVSSAMDGINACSKMIGAL